MNYYAEAIEIITTISGDEAKKILVEIAKFNPSAVVKGFNSSKNKRMLKRVEFLLRGGNKVAAVKEYRLFTRKSLKESTEEIKKIESKLD